MSDEPAPQNPPDATADYAPAPPEPPTALGTVGRFQIRQEVGRGAFGVVYRAHDPVLARDVALKVPKLSAGRPELAERVLREAQLAARLRHPHIVTVYDCGAEADRFFIAFEFVDGKPLSDVLSTERPGHRQAAQWVRGLALALHYAHEQGVVHRDVKPANVLIDAGRPRLTDFGLSKEVLAPPDGTATPTDPAQTGAGAAVGTPAYMAPEQARGEVERVGPRSDQYSLGAVLYELLTGRRPFAGNAAEVIAQVSDPAAKPLPPCEIDAQIPLGLEAIALKALAKAPAARYPTAADMAVDLQRWLNGDAVEAPLRDLEGWVRPCPACSRLNSRRATKCMYCGRPLVDVNPVDPATLATDPAPEGRRATRRERLMERWERLVEGGIVGWVVWAVLMLGVVGYVCGHYARCRAAHGPDGNRVVFSSREGTTSSDRQFHYLPGVSAPRSFLATSSDFLPDFGRLAVREGFGQESARLVWGVVIGVILTGAGVMAILLIGNPDAFLRAAAVVRWLILLPAVVAVIAHDINYKYTYEGDYTLTVYVRSESGREITKATALMPTEPTRNTPRDTTEREFIRARVAPGPPGDGGVKVREFKGRYSVVKSLIGRTRETEDSVGSAGYDRRKTTGEVWVQVEYADGAGACLCLPNVVRHDHIKFKFPYDEVRSGPAELTLAVP